MSSSIQPCPLPENALLNKYHRDGGYTDCYMTETPIPVSHAQYVTAFYTTALFKLERFILTWTVSKPSTDAQAKQLRMEQETHLPRGRSKRVRRINS